MRSLGMGIPPRGPNNALPLRAPVSETEVPGLGERLIPNAYGEVVYPGVGGEEDRVVRYRINEYGFRDLAYPPEHRPGTYRIVVLGDSVAYGTGVQLAETLAKQMEKRFGEFTDEARFEVLNFAVYDTNTRQQVALLMHQAWLWNPDMVLVLSNVNDASGYGLPESEVDLPEARWMERLGLTSGIWTAREGQVLPPAVRRTNFLRRHSVLVDRLCFVAHNALFARMKERSYSADWELGSPGYSLVRRALAEAADHAREHGYALRVAMDPSLVGALGEGYPYAAEHEVMASICATLGIPYLDLRPAYGDRNSRSLRTHAHDKHPSAFAHGLLARYLVDALWPGPAGPPPGTPAEYAIQGIPPRK